ncbi:Zinc finger C2H2-type, partial [Trinorchestia longiramus]
FSGRCPHCTYVTANRGHMQEHLRTHTGERPFSCWLCSYRSSKKSTLKRHVVLCHLK